MMVEECVSNDEMEDGSFYNTIDPNDCEDNNKEEEEEDGVSGKGGYGNSPLDRQEKFTGGGRSCMTMMGQNS